MKALKKGAKINDYWNFYRIKELLGKSKEELIDYLHPTYALKLGLNIKNAKPNQMFTAGINNRDNELLKKAIKTGATNTGISEGEAFIIASDKNDITLFNLLAKNPRENYAFGGGKTGQRYGNSHEGLKTAIYKGNIKIVNAYLNLADKIKWGFPSDEATTIYRIALREQKYYILEKLVNNKRFFHSVNDSAIRNSIKKLLEKIK